MTRGLALFDDQKRFIACRKKGSADTYTLRKIVVDGGAVGWLGLHRRQYMSNPFVLSFLEEQSLVFYTMGGGIFLLAAVVSLLFTKHLLTQVRKLAQGTRAVSELRFDAKIEVTSKDELGELASDFNDMADTLRRYEEMQNHWISDISQELLSPRLFCVEKSRPCRME